MSADSNGHGCFLVCDYCNLIHTEKGVYSYPLFVEL